MWQQWVNVLAGLVVIVVPFLHLSSVAFTWTLVIAGIVVVALSLWHGAELTSTTSENRYAHR